MKWLVVLLICVVSCSCGIEVYQESNEEYSKTFDLMTAQEKVLYDAVDEEWSYPDLYSVREAVRRRDKRPDESTLPFLDIADVIKLNNEVTLKIDESLTSTARAKDKAAKWDGVNPDWYIELTKSISNRESKNRPVKKPRYDIKKYGTMVTIEDPVKVEKAREDGVYIENSDLSLLASDEQLEELEDEVYGCDKAIQLLNRIVSGGLPITMKSYNDIMYLTKVCKAKELQLSVGGSVN